MPWRLRRFALSSRHPEPRMPTQHASLRRSCDVVISGAGGHGLAAACYLARDHGGEVVTELGGDVEAS